MRFRLLGPLQVVTAGDDEVRIGRAKLRMLLAVLLARANTVVSVDVLVDDVWGDDPPASAVSNLRSYVWALRRLLAPADPAAAPISTDPHGYLLDVVPERLDVFAFERLLADGTEARRRGDVRLAADRIEAALGLWRGTALQNVPCTGGTLAATAQRLEEQRLAATEELFDDRLALGRHAGLVGELQALVVHHPLRERLWGQMMLALYRDGRQAEALAAYRRLHAHLTEQIGVEPSQPLRALQRQILRSDPGLAPSGVAVSAAALAVADDRTPRQLPLDVPTFIGRERELTTLRGLLWADNGGGHGPVVVIHGPAGAGKSALAVRAARLSAGCYPDGQLYVNLRGATPGVAPLSPSEALGRFLRALGVQPADVPHDVEEAAAQFRTLVATRRMIIVLDDAATAGQVRPLLPGLSRCPVLVTSRAGLATLAGTTHLALGPLDPGTSCAMLERLLGVARTAADLPATARLAELCDHLPLGLHVAAARLIARPAWPVRHLVDRLADERNRLTELAAGDLAVRSSLEVSHAALHHGDDPGDRAAARALRLIGLLPVTDLDAHAAAALLRTSPVEADLVLERLLDAHLLAAMDANRYHLHDLVRLFARELARAAVPSGQAAAATSRVLRHYVATVRAAIRLVYPTRSLHEIPGRYPPPRPFRDDAEAHCWLVTERTNLLAMARHAGHGPDDHARLGIALTLSLHWFLALEGYPRAEVEISEQAIALARRLGDQRREAYASGCAGLALRELGRFAEATARLAAELTLCRQVGDRFGEQRALGNLGTTHLIQGNHTEAVICLERQLMLARRIGAITGEMFALQLLGRLNHHLGRHDQAVRLTERALAWYHQTGDDYRACGATERLALIYVDLGRCAEAVDLLGEALERARRARYRLGEAHALISLARLQRSLGATDTAVRCAEEAIAIVGPMGAAGEVAAAERERSAACETTGADRVRGAQVR